MSESLERLCLHLLEEYLLTEKLERDLHIYSKASPVSSRHMKTPRQWYSTIAPECIDIIDIYSPAAAPLQFFPASLGTAFKSIGSS